MKLSTGFFCACILFCIALSACNTTAPTLQAPTLAPIATQTRTLAPTQTPLPKPSPALTQDLPKGASDALDDDVLVIYRKHGGIAGIDETLVVHQGGLLELTQRGGAKKSAHVDEPQIQIVRRMLEQKDFSELDELYQAAGADLFVYVITARDSSGKPKTVTTMDAANTPPYLGQLIAMLNQLRAQVK